ncbi:M15 family metallopeptidase [Pseudooceanicola sp. C21-150M6]|uniref:M15 family metallopeptidase n=1 Tax=Pseudooceanicola sp. C21-150M6 TaxID=3434355 RepID=UPI003D7F3C27
MRPVPIIIGAIAVILLALAVFAAIQFMPRSGSGGAVFDITDTSGTAVDSSARIEIEVLRQQIEALQDLIAEQSKRIDQLQSSVSRGPASLVPADPGQALPRSGPNAIVDAYAQVVLIANRTGVNRSLTTATPSFLEGLLGRPRQVLSDNCEAMENPRLREMLEIADVGPVKVNMLRPVVESLRTVFENVRRADQDLYDRINTSGSLCVRRIRGTSASLSSHSFGTAIDLNIDGQLDNFTDGKTQLGLTILADFFREEGWIWGAGFRREDSMHFEVSREKLQEWREEGRI